MLIAPFARVSNGLRSGVVHVEVDGILRYVPFAALHDGRRFWVERATVRQYEPRASQNHARKRNHVFTGSQASPRGVLVAVSAANSANGTESLPFANAEVASIAEIWRAKRGAQGVVRNDIDASEFRRLIATEPTLLHVAAHFKLVPGDETRSFLSLAKGDRLSVFDLRNMDFTKTKLVVLSACDTSLDMADGAEIGGLPRVLLEAGAGSVVGTLWAISDQSTSAWMETMYRQLNIVGVDRVADAITITQRAFLSDPLLPKAWRHPYHWAAFSLMASTQ